MRTSVSKVTSSSPLRNQNPIQPPDIQNSTSRHKSNDAIPEVPGACHRSARSDLGPPFLFLPEHLFAPASARQNATAGDIITTLSTYSDGTRSNV
ncbi:hypothetical protein L228DRAFT_128505 [Xylona heveae TC161]|uniref:Uncharacterized protein n=1 Tax=Xylona heveae (strain CBS 132557 / TC161) TaxID=1328760 RepID=A0A165GSS4_XYLHT|nr:hypothetical protein L228DRAFT_128505 [Xylona heveae TC161]KZF22551.1 hypothetical protein L228DRAFT_128505 [Xylona heveae TC161]